MRMEEIGHVVVDHIRISLFICIFINWECQMNVNERTEEIEKAIP